MKKLFTVLVILLLSAGMILTGCGGADTKNEPAGESAPAVSEDARNDAYLGDGTTLGNLIEFTAADIDGAEYTQSDFEYKDLYIINFWSTTCPPCIAEMPELEKLRASLPENIEFMTFCFDGMMYPDTAKSIIEETGWQGRTLVSGSGDLEGIMQRIMYTPTTLFFSGDGFACGSAVIGVQNDTVAFYTGMINDILTAMNKPAI